MKLITREFDSARELSEFVNNKCIKRENIQQITFAVQTATYREIHCLFYWDNVSLF